MIPQLHSVQEPKEYSFKSPKVEVELGIDEAGRGPVLGPMVYGVCFWPKESSQKMKQRFGFADSKQLKESQRKQMLNSIKKMDGSELGWFVTVLDPEFLSNSMLSVKGNANLNLNNISHMTAINLIKKVRDTGVTVTKCILDTVGTPEKYRYMIQKELNDPKIEVVVESKADDKYPVVSAASICAKVTRDHVLEAWTFKEKGLATISREFGCGYPGNDVTKTWLRQAMDPIYGFPTIVRFSWKTASKFLEDNGSKIEWYDPVPENENKFQKYQKYQKGGQTGSKGQGTPCGPQQKNMNKKKVAPLFLFPVAQNIKLTKGADFEI